MNKNYIVVVVVVAGDCVDAPIDDVPSLTLFLPDQLPMLLQEQSVVSHDLNSEVLVIVARAFYRY